MTKNDPEGSRSITPEGKTACGKCVGVGGYRLIYFNYETWCDIFGSNGW